MNFDDITRYFSYLELLSLVVGVVFVGGSIAVPSLNKVAEDLLGEHVVYLAMILVLAVAWVFVNMFTGNTNATDVLLEAFLAIFFFSLFIVISMGVSGVTTGKLNWLLILGTTLVMNYVFNHYFKAALIAAS